MSNCPVCHSDGRRDELVDNVFRIDGKYVVVHRVPAEVCSRCGDESFSRETAEKIRLLVNGHGKPKQTVALDVFDFV
jgi:YgiT-type zinc finger domain-containing protein